MKKILVVSGILLIGFLLFSCAPKEVPKPAPQVPVTEVKQLARESWEPQWEQVKNNAKKEGKVVLYTTAGGPVFTTLMTSMKQKFGIDLEITSGRSAEIIAKINTERKAGLFLPDIYIGGSTTSVSSLKPSGILLPLEPALLLPDVIDPKSWTGGGLNWVDSQHLILSFLAYPSTPIAINTSQVRKDEISSYKDLLNPKWKGKITFNDPSVGGPGGNLGAAIAELIMGYDYLKELAKQDVVISRDERLQVEWLAQGKYPIGIAPASEVLLEYQNAGAPVLYVIPVEGTYLSSGSGSVSLISDAPHPNAGKVFLNWLLTKEPQTIYQNAFGAQSARLDVSTEGLDPNKIRQPNTKYFQTGTEEFLSNVPNVRLKVKEIFGIK